MSQSKHPQCLTLYTPGAADRICGSLLANHKVILFGIDGVGKTELMIQVRDRLLQARKIDTGDYLVLNYVDTMEETIKASAPPAFEEGWVMEALYKVFSRNDRIVFINGINQTVKKDASLCYLTGLKNVLITAGSADVLGEYGDDFVKYEIVLPSENECRELFDDPRKDIAYNPFARYSKIAGEGEEKRQFVFDTIYDSTAGHPMALRLFDELIGAVGHYELLKKVRELRVDITNALSSVKENNDYEPLYAEFEKLIGLYLESGDCDEKQRWLLGLFALMPYRMLREADILAFTDKKYKTAPQRLSSRSLLQSHKSRRGAGGAGVMYYAIHPITAKSVRSAGIDIEPYRELVYKLQETLCELPKNSHTLCHYAWMTQLIRSAAMYYMHREGKKYDDSLRAVLFSCLGTVFLERASTDEKQHYTRAETWLNRALEIQERQLKANPTDRTRLDLAITLCNLGELYRDRHEDYERAREFLTRALELKRKIYLHFPKIKLHLAKSCGMLAKTMYGMYEKSKDRAFLQSALDLGGETLGLLDWKSELEIQIYTSEFQRLMSKITYDYYGNNVKRAIHHQLAARDYNTGAMGVLEEVEDKSYSRYSRPRGAGFVHAALHCELADLCKRLSALYWEDNEYGRARFYSEYVDRKEATRERLRNSERVF